MGLLFKEKPNCNLMSVAMLIACCSSLQNGYVSSVLNIPQKFVERFVNESNYDRYDSYMTQTEQTMIWSLIVVQRQLGQLAGTIITPFICGWLGRKGTILFNTGPLCVGLFLQFLSKYVDMWPLLLVGRFIWSVGCGIVAVICPMFLSEIAPNNIRGGIASIHGMMLGFGSLCADFFGLPQILGNASLWSCEYLFVFGLQVIQFFILLFLPESPKDLYIRQEKTQKAVKSLIFYHKNHDEDHIRETLIEYDREKDAGHTAKFPIKQLWGQKDLRMAMLVGIGATASYAFGGMQIITNYTTEIFESTGSNPTTAAYCSLGLGFIRFFAVFPSIYIVEKYGRRPLLLWSLFGCIVCFFLMGIGTIAYDHEYNKASSVIVIISTLSYGLMFSIGIQTIGTFLPSELVPTQQRAANQGVAVMFRFIIALVTTYVFLPLQRNFGGYCYLELIIPLIFTLWFMYRCMPETKDREIVYILNELNGPRDILAHKFTCCPRRGAKDEGDTEHLLGNGYSFQTTNGTVISNGTPKHYDGPSNGAL